MPTPNDRQEQRQQRTTMRESFSPETPSPVFLAMGHNSRDKLEDIMRKGEMPDPEALVGWEYRGYNTMPLTHLLGIKKFSKGFFSKGSSEYGGYNVVIQQADLSEPWTAKNPAQPKRHGYYALHAVKPNSRDNLYLNSLLLDYSRGDNPRLDPSKRLRDYLVRVDPGSDELLLGKAYIAVGPARIPVSYFILERMKQAAQ